MRHYFVPVTYFDIAELSAFDLLSFCLLFVSRQKVVGVWGGSPLSELAKVE